MDMSDENRNALLEAGRKLLEARRKQLLAGGGPSPSSSSAPTTVTTGATSTAHSSTIVSSSKAAPVSTNPDLKPALNHTANGSSTAPSKLASDQAKISAAVGGASVLNGVSTTKSAPSVTFAPLLVAGGPTPSAPAISAQEYEKLKAELTSMREKAQGLESSLADRESQLRVAREEASRLQQQLQSHQAQQKAAAEADQRNRTAEASQRVAELSKARDDGLQRVKELETALQERQRMAATLQQQVNEQRLYQERLEADVTRSREQLDQAISQREDTTRTLERATREIASMRETLTLLTNEKSSLAESVRQREATIKKLQNQLQTLETTDAMRDAQKQAQAADEQKRMDEMLAEKDEVIGSIQKINQQLYSEQNKLKADLQLAQQMIEENLKMVAELENAMEQLLNENAEPVTSSPSGSDALLSEDIQKQIRAEADNIARVFASEISRLREEITAAAPIDSTSGHSSIEELQERKILQLLAALDSLSQTHTQHVEELTKARLLDTELRSVAQQRQQLAEKCLNEKQSYLAQLESELNRNGALLAEIHRVRDLLQPEQTALAKQVLERLERLETQEEITAQRTRLSEVSALLVDSRLDKLTNSTPVAALPPLHTPVSSNSPTVSRDVPASPGTFAEVPLTPAPAKAAPVPAASAAKGQKSKQQQAKGGSNCILS